MKHEAGSSFESGQQDQLSFGFNALFKALKKQEENNQKHELINDFWTPDRQNYLIQLWQTYEGRHHEVCRAMAYAYDFLGKMTPKQVERRIESRMIALIQNGLTIAYEAAKQLQLSVQHNVLTKMKKYKTAQKVYCSRKYVNFQEIILQILRLKFCQDEINQEQLRNVVGYFVKIFNDKFQQKTPVTTSELQKKLQEMDQEVFFRKRVCSKSRRKRFRIQPQMARKLNCLSQSRLKQLIQKCKAEGKSMELIIAIVALQTGNDYQLIAKVTDLPEKEVSQILRTMGKQTLKYIQEEQNKRKKDIVLLPSMRVRMYTVDAIGKNPDQRRYELFNIFREQVLQIAIKRMVGQVIPNDLFENTVKDYQKIIKNKTTMRNKLTEQTLLGKWQYQQDEKLAELYLALGSNRYVQISQQLKKQFKRSNLSRFNGSKVANRIAVLIRKGLIRVKDECKLRNLKCLENVQDGQMRKFAEYLMHNYSHMMDYKVRIIRLGLSSGNQRPNLIDLEGILVNLRTVASDYEIRYYRSSKGQNEKVKKQICRFTERVNTERCRNQAVKIHLLDVLQSQGELETDKQT